MRPPHGEGPVGSDDWLLRLPEVLRLFPVSRSSWYRGIADGRFPQGVKLSARAVAWRKSDIDSLIQALVPDRRGSVFGAVSRRGPW
jgi:prophage regulatory protein